MKTNANLFWILAAFFVVADVAYIVWNLIDHGAIEWVGTLAIGLSGALSALIAFYIGRTYAAQGGELAEDRLDANIDDGDPEVGFFSPWSWWPIMLAGSAAILVLGVAIGWWIAMIGGAITVIAVVGWTFEYNRGNFIR